jgi:putative ABC transport system substrate-binding protein
MMDRHASRLSRRRFVLGVGAAGGALLAGCGPLPFQQPPPTAVKVHRIGFLNGGSPATSAPVLDIFRQALGELGYVEGQNLIIEYRWGEGSDTSLAGAAAELARLPVEVIVVPSALIARTARAATSTVPILLAGTGDLVAAGLAASYARPGGNITGVTNLAGQLSAKRLQLLKEAVPSLSRVAVFWDAVSNSPFSADAWGRDAQAVGVQLHPMLLRGPEELDDAFEVAAQEGVDGLLAFPSPLASVHRTRIIQLAAGLRWPAMYYQRRFVEEGGLMAYDGSQADLWQRAAVYVDKILKGANSADLPIEQPMRFDFVVNAAAAEALGLTFPESTRLQITEVVR